MTKPGGIIVLFLCLGGAALFATPPEFSGVDRLIDFRLSYPVLDFKSGANIRQKNYLGMDIGYQYLAWRRFGGTFNIGGWVVPIRLGAQKTRVGAGTLLGGVIVRPLPDNYFDPFLQVLGGGAWMQAGRGGGSCWSAATGARVSANLFRQQQLFQDLALALALSSSAMYFSNMLSSLKPFMYDVGLSIRGGF